jgi:hypothetical protein
MESNAIYCYLKNLPVKGICGRCLSVWGPFPFLGFCLGWYGTFVGSESGPIQNVKLLQNMVSNTTQHPRPSPPSHKLSVYTALCLWEGGGGGEAEIRLEGQYSSSQSWVKNTNITDCISSP